MRHSPEFTAAGRDTAWPMEWIDQELDALYDPWRRTKQRRCRMPEEPKQPTPESPQPDKTKKTRPTKPLPTERIAYQKQIDILRAYAIATEANGGKPVTNNDVAAIVKMAATTLPHANSFFAEIGLLQRVEGGYVPAPEVINFHRAYAWNAETAPHKLAPVVQSTWFGQVLLPRLSFRSMDEAEAIAVLAEASGAAPEYKGQLGLLLNYLDTAGLIERDGGLVKANKTPVGSAQMPGSQPVTTPPQIPTAETGAVATTFNRPKTPGVQFQINVDVDMKEFATWTPERISAFFAGVAQVLSAKGAIEKID